MSKYSEFWRKITQTDDTPKTVKPVKPAKSTTTQELIHPSLTIFEKFKQENDNAAVLLGEYLVNSDNSFKKWLTKNNIKSKIKIVSCFNKLAGIRRDYNIVLTVDGQKYTAKCYQIYRKQYVGPITLKYITISD